MNFKNFSKRTAALTLVAVMGLTTAVMAAPAYKTLRAVLGVNMIANGQLFTPEESMRPFIAEGRTFISVAALQNMGIADVSWDDASKTVTVNPKGDPNTAVSAVQIKALQEENAKFKADNASLKAQIDTLKADLEKYQKTESKAKEQSNFTDLNATDRRDLERQLAMDLRSLRADTSYARQYFGGSPEVRLTRNTVEITLTDTTLDVNRWNDAVSNFINRRGYLQEEYGDFFKNQVLPVIQADLKNYKGYDVNVNISGISNDSKLVIKQVDYNKTPLKNAKGEEIQLDPTKAYPTVSISYRDSKNTVNSTVNYFGFLDSYYHNY